MKLSYEGIGQWAATFAASDVAEGELVKISANGTVAAWHEGGPLLRHGALRQPGRRRLCRGPGRPGDGRIHRDGTGTGLGDPLR